MSKKSALIIASAVLSMISLSAQAGNGYIGASIANLNYQEPGTSLYSNALGGRLGYRLGRFFDVEVRAATATNAANDTREFNLDYLAGAYAKINWQPIASSHFEIYLIGGATYINGKVGPVANTTSETDSSSSYGFGIDMFGSDTTAFSLEWIRYGDGKIGSANTPYTLDFFNIGIVHHF